MSRDEQLLLDLSQYLILFNNYFKHPGCFKRKCQATFATHNLVSRQSVRRQKREKNPNFPKAAGFKDSHSLLLLDLHGEAFHVSVFKVEAEVLPAEAQVGRHAVRRQSGGLGRRDGKRLEGREARRESNSDK